MKGKRQRPYRSRKSLFASSTSPLERLKDLLNKYGMRDGEIVTEDGRIFGDEELAVVWAAAVSLRSWEEKPLQRITILYFVSSDRTARDFDRISQDLSRNLPDISSFLEQIAVVLSIDIHLKAFDAPKALPIVGKVVDSAVDCINFIFDAPTFDNDSWEVFTSHLRQFCCHPFLKSPKIRFKSFPLCIFPAEYFKYLYRHMMDDLKGRVFAQQKLIKDSQSRQFTYLKPCQTCRCRVPCYVDTYGQDLARYISWLSPREQTTLVFVGGSLPREERPVDADILYAAPAEQGDMCVAILEGFQNIIILDGFFYDKFPCTTFEVLLALENDVNVFGASSIGALRAVELDQYGMVGSGYVYEYFKKQSIKPYHIVAQTYRANDAPFTIPLASIIYFLEFVVSKGVVSKKVSNKLFDIANNIHFSALSFKCFFRMARSKRGLEPGVVPALEKIFSSYGESFFDVKKKDALALLKRFRHVLRDRRPGHVKEVFEQAKERYLRALYGKYSCRYDLTLPKDWRASFKRSFESAWPNARDHRECSAEETCRRAEKFFEGLDVVVADTSRYDATSSFVINVYFIPFYFLDYGISCASGNGEIFAEALASAYMELAERIPLFEFRVPAMRSPGLSSMALSLLRLPQYYNWGIAVQKKRKVFERKGYLVATDILSQEDILVPKSAIMGVGSGSEGNASGNSLPEAILYGVYELIERDITQVYNFSIPQELKTKLVIDKKALQDKRCHELCEQFEAKGTKIVLLNLVNIYDVSCVMCLVYDLNGKMMNHGGTAVRGDLDAAAYAALNEAYHAYIILFAGTRDDWRPLSYKFRHAEYQQGHLFFSKEKGFIKTTPKAVKYRTIDEELNDVICKVTRSGIRDIIVADTSPAAQYKLKSVKVIIPGMDLVFIDPFQPSSFFKRKVAATLKLIGSLGNTM